MLFTPLETIDAARTRIAAARATIEQESHDRSA
jgi:hypothetical protein